MEKTLIKELSQLNKSEKMLLVEALWNSIASEPGQLGIPDPHKQILEERLQTLERDRQSGDSWEGIRQKYL